MEVSESALGYLLAGAAELVCSSCSISGLVSVVSGAVVCSSEVVDCSGLVVTVCSLSSASGIAGVGLTVKGVDCGNLSGSRPVPQLLTNFQLLTGDQYNSI